jgi:hypothetical protein
MLVCLSSDDFDGNVKELRMLMNVEVEFISTIWIVYFLNVLEPQTPLL